MSVVQTSKGPQSAATATRADGKDRRRASPLNLDGKAIAAFWRRSLRGPTARTRMLLYDEIAPSLGAGVGLRQSLEGARARHGGRGRRRALDALAGAAASGTSLAEAMRAEPDVFSPLETALVAAGERTGRLDAAFRAASAELSKARAASSRTLQASLYPLFLAHFFVLVPLPLARGASVTGFALPLLAALWAAAAGLTSLHVGLRGSRGYAAALARIPVVGGLRRAGSLARFARCLAALHASGSSHGESVRLAADASGDAEVRADASVAAHLLDRGASLPQAFDAMACLPQDDRNLLVAGEQSGELESAATRVADLEQARRDALLGRTMALLPALLVLLVGLAVAWLAISFYGRLFSGF